MILTPKEIELLEAFRMERTIYNGALTDAVAALIATAHVSISDPTIEELTEAILALRKED